MTTLGIACVLTGLMAGSASLALAQEAQAPAQQQSNAQPTLASREDSTPAAEGGKQYQVPEGTHIPLALINSVSTRSAAVGDRIYLETVFPILADGRIVIPPGSYVAGTITDIKRPGKLKGRGEFHLRFDSLTLPNGATRDFRGHLEQLDGRASESLDRKEGSIRSEGNKSGDLKTVGEVAAAGASIGALGGLAAGRPGMGAGIGAGAGAAAALIGIMLTRGPEAVLAKGTTVEMILDRQVTYNEKEIDFSTSMYPRMSSGEGSGPLPSQKLQQPRSPLPFPGRRF